VANSVAVQAVVLPRGTNKVFASSIHTDLLLAINLVQNAASLRIANLHQVAFTERHTWDTGPRQAFLYLAVVLVRAFFGRVVRAVFVADAQVETVHAELGSGPTNTLCAARGKAKLVLLGTIVFVFDGLAVLRARFVDVVVAPNVIGRANKILALAILAIPLRAADLGCFPTATVIDTCKHQIAFALGLSRPADSREAEA